MRTQQVQDDLFACDATMVSVDTSFAAAKRIALDESSWIDVVPGWMAGSRALFDCLAEHASWSQRDRRLFEQTFQEPRLTAEYRHLVDVPNEGLLEAIRALSRQYEVDYDGLWVNLYRQGTDSTGFHRDRFSAQRNNSVVPVLTLGATRRFVVRPRNGGASIAFRPTSGDLIVMGGRCQEDWVHGVPKEPGITEPRMSINFQSSKQSGRQAA